MLFQEFITLKNTVIAEDGTRDIVSVSNKIKHTVQQLPLSHCWTYIVVARGNLIVYSDGEAIDSWIPQNDVVKAAVQMLI